MAIGKGNEVTQGGEREGEREREECEESEGAAARGVMCSSVDQHVVGLWYMISVTLDSIPPSLSLSQPLPPSLPPLPVRVRRSLT